MIPEPDMEAFGLITCELASLVTNNQTLVTCQNIKALQ